MKSDRMLLRYTYYSHSWSSSMTSVNGRMGFNTDNKWGLVRYTDGSKTNNCTSAGVYNGA